MEDEEEEVDEYDDNPAPVEAAKKAKDAGTTVATTTTNNGGSSSSSINNKNITAAIASNSDYKDDVVAPPKVSPVAASPSMGKPPSSAVDDEDDDEHFDGSGGSGAGTGSNVDDENEEEDDYDDTPTDEDGIDLGSVITEPVPKTTMKPEKKPEVVVVAPTAPTKAPKETTQAPSSPPPLSGGRDENQVPVEPMTTPVPGPMDPSQGSGGSLDGNRGHNDVQILDHKPDERQASFFAQPGILAGKFIKYSQGVLLFLLCPILLLLFCSSSLSMGRRTKQGGLRKKGRQSLE